MKRQSKYVGGWYCLNGHDNPDEQSPCADLTHCDTCGISRHACNDAVATRLLNALAIAFGSEVRFVPAPRTLKKSVPGAFINGDF